MRPETRSAVVLSTLAAALLLGQTVFAKAARDALFLTSYPVTALPALLIAAAVLSLLAMLLSGRVLSVYGPERVVPIAFVASAGLYVAEFWLARRWPSVAAVAVYLHLAVLAAIVSSGFWSVINERFDPHTAKKVFGRIAAGGTAGAVVGGISAWQIGSHLDIPTMLLALAALNLACAAIVRRLARSPAGAPPDGGREVAQGGLAVLREVPFLRQLGLLVALIALLQSQLDYVLKDAATSLAARGDLVTFFAIFHASAGLLSFAVQSLASRRSLEELGLAGTIAILPAAVVLAGVARLLFPALWSSVLLAGVEAVLATSLYRASYELFYTPVAKPKKRAAKTIIDVGLDRIGTSLGGALAIAAVALAADDPTRIVVAIAIAAALAALWVTTRLHGGYVAALAESLETGAVRLDPDELQDPATRRTLAETHAALSRSKLLEEIGRLRQKKGVAPADTGPDLVLASMMALRSGDAEQIRGVLARGPLAPELVAPAIALLERNELLDAVTDALRAVAPRATGQLVDALLDRATPDVVRRRLPRILQAVPGPRVVAGLVSALEDPVFDVRLRAAAALSRIAEGDRSLTPERDAILAAAVREADAAVASAARPRRPDPDPRASQPTEDDDSPLADEAVRSRIDRHLEGVFTILSITLERAPLRLAFRALATDDPVLRGTALEYLDNVLPDRILERLRPLFGRPSLPPAPPRPQPVVVQQLLASSDAIELHLDTLRRRE